MRLDARSLWTTLAGLLLLTCCGPAEPPEKTTDWLAGWSVLVDGHSAGAINSAWSNGKTGADREWLLVGGTATSAVIFELRGENWKRHDLPNSSMLWWVHGDSSGRRVAVGDRGQLVHWKRQDSEINAISIPELATTTTALYGTWFQADDPHLWLVGGTPSDGLQPGPLWKVPFSALDADIGKQATKFDLDGSQGVLSKIWSADGERLWAVGDDGKIWTAQGDKWSLEGTFGIGRMVGIHGRSADDIVAVGGSGEGVVVRRDSNGWKLVSGGSGSFVNSLSAVIVMDDGTAVVGGSAGYVGRQKSTSFDIEMPTLDPPLTECSLHGAFGDRHTQLIVGDPLKCRKGTVLQRGKKLPSLPLF